LYFWSRVSGVTTLRRPCGIEYCGCVCFMLILMFCSFACKIYEYEYKFHSKCSKCRPTARTQARILFLYTPLARVYVLPKSAPDCNESLHVIHASLLHPLLHDAPNFVVNWVQAGAVCRPQIRSDEIGRGPAGKWPHERGGPGRYPAGRCDRLAG